MSQTDHAPSSQEPDGEALFALMFGQPALLARPSRYHLMLLGEESGLDLHLSWESMRAASRKASIHEEAFSWLALSRDPDALHATLLECLLRECSRVHDGSSPRLTRGPSRLAAKAASRTSTFLAYALAAPGRFGEATIRAARERAPELFAGCSASPIPARLSLSLRGALDGAQAHQREEAIEAALEALEISSNAQRPGVSGPRSARL